MLHLWPRPAGQVEQLDVLVNNAGVMIDGKTATEADVDTFPRTYETNVFGVLAVTNAFLPVLRRSAHPRIVNVSSGTGSFGMEHRPESAVPPRDRRDRRRASVIQDGTLPADGVLRASACLGGLQSQRARPWPQSDQSERSRRR